MNELVGGSANGHEYLLESSFNWGQDLLLLKDWYEEHPAARPIHVATHNAIDSSLAGLNVTLPPRGPNRRALNIVDSRSLGPLPGWYAIDVFFLHDKDSGYAYFRHFKAIDRVGYTILIYHLEDDDVNRVRKSLGLDLVDTSVDTSH